MYILLLYIYNLYRAIYCLYVRFNGIYAVKNVVFLDVKSPFAPLIHDVRTYLCSLISFHHAISRHVTKKSLF